MFNNDELDMSSNIFDLNKDNSNLNIKDNDDINKIISNISENLENKKTFEENNLLQNNNINQINNNVNKNNDNLLNNYNLNKNIIQKDKNNLINLNNQNNTNLNKQNNTNLNNQYNKKLNNQNTKNLNNYKNILLDRINKFITKNKKKIKKTIITILSFMVINSQIVNKIISKLNIPTKINNLCQNLIKSIFFILINYLIKKNI